MLKLLIASFSAFIIFIMGHWLHFHYIIPFNRVSSMFTAAGLGLLVYFVIYKLLPDENVLVTKLGLNKSALLKSLPLMVGGLFYAFLFLGYLEFYFTADRSITFRMLRMTDEKQGQVITSEEMLAQYDTKGIVLRRFEDLVYGGYMAKQGEQYSLTAKGKFILSIYRPTIDFLHMQKY